MASSPKSTLIKIGRFAYFLPYIIMPLIVMALYQEEFSEAALLSFFLPFAIESSVIILYPLSWVTSVVCFILCAVESKRTGKGKVANIIFAIITGVLLIFYVALILLFLFNLSFAS